MKLIAYICDGHAVIYDTADVIPEHSEIGTRNDIEEVPSDGPWIKRELTGYSHLDLHLAFKHNKRALWMATAEAAALMQHPTDEAVQHAAVAALARTGFSEADARAFVGLPPLTEALGVTGKEGD